MKLAGKVALVTGASKGIGAAIAKRYAAEGAKVVVNYVSSKDAADRVVDEIKGQGGEAVAVKADVGKPEEVPQLFAAAAKAFGRVDILVNNAGVYEFRPLAQIDAEHYRRQFDINVLGTLLATKEAAAQFGDAGGVVINLSSVVSATPGATASVYSATKAAVDAITRALALELGPKVRVNSIAPGLVLTEGVAAMDAHPSFGEYVMSRTPLQRFGQPEDIANLAVFLASEESSWITGERMLVGGGARL